MGTSSNFYVVFLTIVVLATTTFATYFPRPTHQNQFVLKQSKKPQKPYKSHYFPQQLDHFTFTPESSKIFYQKYLVNDTYWEKKAPIFVYTGNEGSIEWFADNTGLMFDIAPKFKALLVFIEHRYYGESLPFGKNSYKSAKSLGYLNSQQALADFAVLIRSLKQNLSSEESPVVVFGGSYGGNGVMTRSLSVSPAVLAAWFRMKYPHITIGALASSAPILQFDEITPWSAFYDAVSQDFKEASLNCYEVIKGSWVELEAMKSQKGGLAELSRIFRSCKVLQSADSARDWLWTAFVYTPMVNYPTEANFMMPLPAYPVEEMCKIIDDFPPGATKLVRAFAAASLYYNYTGTEKCFDIENGTDDHGSDDGWGWQACTELIMPMTCSNESMFTPSTFDYKGVTEYCVKKYGVMPRPHWITTEFGGERIYHVLKRSGSNIIFSNGMQDPWSRGSVLKNISSSIVALVTEKGAHHLDFRSATKDDPKWLIEQRRQEVEIIQGWIDEYNADLRCKGGKTE
ncbi:Peptidase S28 [Dillenia turbinata]|uniref:Peptidase S28 n=1 Tax=Dillenia turbinata TaxID=194707 RepID=A0AAN8W303_9MAGN